MSEEQKYYTPALEDLHPGMLVEVNTSGNKENPKYELWTISDEDVSEISQILWDLKHRENAIRVPYLTAEQIEAEGWTVDEDFPADDGQILPFVLNFENDQTSWYYHLWHNPDDSGMEIVRHQGADMYTVFHGSCRCINDFRAIIRLCNII